MTKRSQFVVAQWLDQFFVPRTLADVLEEPERAQGEDEQSADGEGAAVVALHVGQPDDGASLHHRELKLLRGVQTALPVEVRVQGEYGGLTQGFVDFDVVYFSVCPVLLSLI